VDHATLGAIVDTDEDGRVVVTNIVESSDAFRRGLRYGDELVAFAGRPISTANGFKNILGIFPKGWRLPLSYRREGQRIDTLVRLAGVHSNEELIRKTQQNVEPPAPRPDPENPREPSPPDQPRPPGRPRISPHSTPQSPPTAVAERFEARRGYANHHYNQLELERVWEALRNQGDFSTPNSVWTMRGTLNDRTTLRVELDDRQAMAHIVSPTENRELLLDLRGDLAQQLLPEGSGGLLTALHQWRRLLTQGPAKYGEVYYLGTAPWPNHETLADVLVGINDVVETSYYFDPNSGALIGLEMYPDSGVDPCEIHFRDYRSLDGRQVPFELEIRYGDVAYGVWKLEAFTINSLGSEGV
jgi:hypothetical protein